MLVFFFHYFIRQGTVTNTLISAELHPHIKK